VTVIAERLGGHQRELAVAGGLDQLLVHRLDDLTDRNLDLHAHPITQASCQVSPAPGASHFDHM